MLKHHAVKIGYFKLHMGGGYCLKLTCPTFWSNFHTRNFPISRHRMDPQDVRYQHTKVMLDTRYVPVCHELSRHAPISASAIVHLYTSTSTSVLMYCTDHNLCQVACVSFSSASIWSHWCLSCIYRVMCLTFVASNRFKL